MPLREGESRNRNISTIEITLTKEAKPDQEAKEQGETEQPKNVEGGGNAHELWEKTWLSWWL